VLVYAVIENGLIVDELFWKLRLVELAVVFIDWYFLRLHNVEILTLDANAQDISYGVTTKAIEV
jgi:hypothetical protein